MVRQVCDKPCTNRIIQAEWSPLRDLIAIITSNGEVRLHRMYWQKVWAVPPKESHATCLAWKCNGKLLCVGYENGDLELIEIEKASVVHSASCTSTVTSLCWVAQDKEKRGICYEDCSEKYLPKINSEELRKGLQFSYLDIGEEKQHSILVVGNSCGDVFLYIDGVFPALHISLNQLSDLSACSIICSHLSLEGGVVSVICKGEKSLESESSYYLHQYKSHLLSSRGSELSHLSSKFIKMKNIISVCGSCMKQMSDSSEDVCLKINSKLEKLEELVSPVQSNVAFEFTRTYAIGKISGELAVFLTQHLTAKGLKQIAQNVQSTYVSLRRDVTDLDIIVQQLLFHILELRGILDWHEKFGQLGISLEAVQEWMMNIMQFRLKVQELLDVISSDMKHFKIFFSWLKNILYQASEDLTQINSFQLSNEEYDLMLDFLEQRLSRTGNLSGNSYNLERISQYFKKGSLDIKAGSVDNAWYDFVKSNDVLNSSPMIVNPNPEATLQELFDRIQERFDDIFGSVSTYLSDSMNTLMFCNLFQAADDHGDDCKSQFSFIEHDRRLLLSNLACTCDSERMFMMEIISNDSLKVTGLQLVSNSGDEMEEANQYQYTLRDVKFYNQDFITVLAEEVDKSGDRLITLLGQVPLPPLLSLSSVILSVNGSNPILDDQIDININMNNHFSEVRRMEAFRGRYLSVNGYSRKVSSIVSMSGRRIRIFDMTAEDDEIEDSTLENDSKLEESLGKVNISD